MDESAGILWWTTLFQRVTASYSMHIGIDWGTQSIRAQYLYTCEPLAEQYRDNIPYIKKVNTLWSVGYMYLMRK